MSFLQPLAIAGYMFAYQGRVVGTPEDGGKYEPPLWRRKKGGMGMATQLRGARTGCSCRSVNNRGKRIAGKAYATKARDIGFDIPARQHMQQGIEKLADAVGITLGPRGRNVVLAESSGQPQVVNDGVTIARAIELDDPVENAGAQLINEVAGKTNDVAGDGTTTACIIARELIRHGLRAVSSGNNPVAIRRGIEKTATELCKVLEEQTTQISSDDDIRAVATISAGNNAEVGDMIADAISKVGPDGVLSIETGSGLETYVEVEEGMAIDRGYISPQFVTNNERLEVEYENALVLITDEKLETAKDVIPILEKVSEQNRPLLVIAEDVTGEALSTLVVNKLRGIVNVCAVKAPGFGERRKSLLQDIAIVTGGTFLAKDVNLSPSTAELDQLGTARKVTVGNSNTTMIADAGSKEDIDARVAQLKKELSETDSTYDTEKLSERIAKLTGGVAVVKVGAVTEAELEDKKLRIEDAKNATFAAIDEGIVPGGGAAFAHLAGHVDAIRNNLTDPEERIGADIVQRALMSPAQLIANNAGVEGDVVVETVKTLPWREGYNAMSDTYEDLVAAGVLDPKKVTRSCLENSASVAGSMLTTQAVITEQKEQKTNGNSSGGNNVARPGQPAPSQMPPGMLSM